MLPGFAVRILDGNHLAASEHRLKELREIAAGPLPGQTLVVWDPDRRLVVDAFPCEDGHAQERSLLIDVLDSMQPGEVWIADRNFCTSLFLFQTAANDAYFIIRQHATNVRWEAVGERRKVGRTATGMVYQQRVDLIDDWGNRLSVRRITIKLDQPTEDGDTEIHLFTNLPNRVKATRIAEVYHGRWSMEGAFGELATALHCEIRSLGYPPAALFAFGVGLVAYNILSVVRTALAAAHGEECLDEISAYYVADEIRGMMRGMMVVISDEQWQRQFGKRSARQMANMLVALAKRVDLACFRKHRRGPKKPTPKRTKFKRKGHVSTARILAESRGRELCYQLITFTGMREPCSCKAGAVMLRDMPVLPSPIFMSCSGHNRQKANCDMEQETWRTSASTFKLISRGLTASPSESLACPNRIPAICHPSRLRSENRQARMQATTRRPGGRWALGLGTATN